MDSNFPNKSSPPNRMSGVSATERTFSHEQADAKKDDNSPTRKIYFDSAMTMCHQLCILGSIQGQRCSLVSPRSVAATLSIGNGGELVVMETHGASERFQSHEPSKRKMMV